MFIGLNAALQSLFFPKSRFLKMFCNKCAQTRNYEEMLNSRTGKVNKLCHICLNNPIQKIKTIIFNDMEEISFMEFGMKRKLCIIIENDDGDLKELFQELNYNILDSTGLFFRCTDYQNNDHLYAKCRYSDKLQKRLVEKRKRNNFGTQKYCCNGTVNIHRNSNSISIFFNHELEHNRFIEKTVDDEIICKIAELSSTNSPSYIYKHLKSTHVLEKIMNLSLSQISYIWKKENETLLQGPDASIDYIKNSKDLTVVDLAISQGKYNITQSRLRCIYYDVHQFKV
jgi:hypothetical protein